VTRVAVVTIAHGRHEHLRHQRRGLLRSTLSPSHHVLVAMDDPALAQAPPPGSSPTVVRQISRTTDGLPLAAARNLGARTAVDLGAELLVFLDVDCIPSPGCVAAYATAAERSDSRDRLLCGPVAYLPPGPPGGPDLDRLHELATPHPARPSPAPGQVVLDDDRATLFWSLSFAVRPDTWDAIGGFDESYVGYGGEDTDFAQRAEQRGVGLAWVGSATAFHQHHPVSDPPVEHAADIVRNATIFWRRWGFWPMRAWLEQLCDLGVVRRDGSGFVLADTASTV
jgi:GT2 family glycosyltransferase